MCQNPSAQFSHNKIAGCHGCPSAHFRLGVLVSSHHPQLLGTWENVGKMLGKCWENVGKMLGK